MRPLSRLGAAVGLALALAACGSTVPTAQQSALNGGTGGLGGDSSGGSSAPLDGSTATSSTGSVPGGTSGSVPQGTTGTALGGGSSSTTGSVGTAGSGTTGGIAVGPSKRGPIQVGITYVLDAAAGAQALGIQGATLGDQKRYAQILVDDINKRGGLGGRKIVPIYYGYDVNPGAPSYAQQDTSACAKFNQDNRVEVAVANFAGPGVWECMRKKSIPILLDGPTGGFGKGDLAKYRQLVVLGGFNLHRRAAEQVTTLVRQNYFATWDSSAGKPGAAPVKIGIITYDLPDWKSSVSGPMVQGLQAAGYAKPQVIAVAAHDSYDNLSKMQGQLANAQLAFRTSGVTHVIIWDDNGVSTLFFMQNAENQKYRPRYGITSGNNMRLLSSGVAPDAQLNGATGMGFVPVFDLDEAKSPDSKYSNPARKSCYARMQKAEATGGSGFNETSAMMYCSVFDAIKDRWDKVPNLTPAGLIGAIEAFGSSFVDPQVASTYLSPTQHDGLAGVWDYFYDSGCGCMKYGNRVYTLAHA